MFSHFWGTESVSLNGCLLNKGGHRDRFYVYAGPSKMPIRLSAWEQIISKSPPHFGRSFDAWNRHWSPSRDERNFYEYLHVSS